jgi:hypothetical protein
MKAPLDVNEDRLYDNFVWFERGMCLGPKRWGKVEVLVFHQLFQITQKFIKIILDKE